MAKRNPMARSGYRTHLVPREVGERVAFAMPSDHEALRFANMAYHFGYRRRWVIRCRWDRDAGKLYVTRAA